MSFCRFAARSGSQVEKAGALYSHLALSLVAVNIVYMTQVKKKEDFSNLERITVQ